MRIPTSFIAAQRAAFQDKSIDHLQKTVTVDTLGGKKESASDTVLGSYACNVQVLSDELTAEKFGLLVGRDILATAETIPIEKGEFVRYANETYYVVETPSYDSHASLLAKKVSG